MICETIRSMIEDGRLPDKEDIPGSELFRHLDTCSECRQATASLEAEERLLQAYRTDLEKAWNVNALRHRVRVRITEPGAEAASWHAFFSRWFGFSGGQWIRGAAYAALSLVLAGSAAWFYFRQYGSPFDSARENTARWDANESHSGRNAPSQPGGEESKQAAGPATDDSSLEGALAAIRRAEKEYLKAIRILDEIVDKKKIQMDQVFAAQLERNLREIDERIEETRKAYYARPADAELAMYMLAAYSRKVELLQDLAS